MFRSAPERGRWWAVGVAGAAPFVAVGAIAVFLLSHGSRALGELSIGTLAGRSWLPLDGLFGLAPLILGTLASTLLALTLAIPVGLATALFLTLHAGPRLRTAVDSAVAVLNGTPSVVIGLWGLTWIVPLVGNSLAAAALVLALMITPTLTLLAGAAMRQVPAELLEAVRALGVGNDVVAGVLMRHARLGILGAVILAATRGLGEAVAVAMVAGNVGTLPSLFGPVATLTTTLILEFDSAVGVHRSALYLGAALVAALIGTVSVWGRQLQRRAGSR